jgi:hypothetical protein
VLLFAHVIDRSGDIAHDMKAIKHNALLAILKSLPGGAEKEEHRRGECKSLS